MIQISSILTSPGLKEPIVKLMFTLDTCSPIPGVIVFSFKDERAMLALWREMIIILDPDILTGYNFINFDLNYLISRSIVLDVPTFRNLGRITGIETKIRDQVLTTRALGTHESKDISENLISTHCLPRYRRENSIRRIRDHSPGI